MWKSCLRLGKGFFKSMRGNSIGVYIGLVIVFIFIS